MIIVFYGFAGKISSAFPYETTGKPLGLMGLFPVFFLFLSIICFVFENRVIADRKLILLKTSLFFIWRSQIVIPVEKCSAVAVKRRKDGSYYLVFIRDEVSLHSFIIGGKERVITLAEKISALTGINYLELS